MGFIDILKSPAVRYIAIGFTVAVIGVTCYYLFVNRDRQGLSTTLREMIKDTKQVYHKRAKAENPKKSPAKVLIEAADALSELSFKKGPLKKAVREYINICYVLANHYNGECTLAPASVKTKIKRFDDLTKKLVNTKSWKEKDEDVDDDEKDEKEAA